MDSIVEHNRRAWDQRVRGGGLFARPPRQKQLRDAIREPALRHWLPERLSGWRVLCLAAGGGRHAPGYAAAGAEVMVLDISPAQLEMDRRVAEEQGLPIRTVEGSMDDLSMFPPGGFDLVMQPVSTCYVPDIGAVYRQVARVLRAGGLYISQHKSPTSLQAGVSPAHPTDRHDAGYVIREPYYRTGPLPEVEGTILREAGTLEFLHRWEQIVGGLCRAGFVVEDLIEPRHDEAHAPPADPGHRARYIAPYVCIKGRRGGRGEGYGPAHPLVVP